MDLTGWLCVESLNWTNDKAAKKMNQSVKAVFVCLTRRAHPLKMRSETVAQKGAGAIKRSVQFRCGSGLAVSSTEAGGHLWGEEDWGSRGGGGGAARGCDRAIGRSLIFISCGQK